MPCKLSVNVNAIAYLRNRRHVPWPSVVDLCRKRGFEVVERRIRPEELEGFSECFITGSAAEVTLVSEIGPYKFITGNMGKVIMEDYSDEVRQKSKVAA